MIIEWPLNGQFHNAVTDVLTSQTDLRQLDVDDDDDVPLLGFIYI